MKVPLYTMEGSSAGEVELDAQVFGIEAAPELVQQAVSAQMANRRLALAHAKDRSEVSGGGRKPWRQKGTGRARHGSNRSPLWAGGGVTFGPRNTRNYRKSINAKAKRKALLACLTRKAKDGGVVVLEALTMESPKTKTLTNLVKKLSAREPVLVVLPKASQAVVRSARNVPRMGTILANSLNVVDVLRAGTLLITKESLPIIRETFGRK